MTRTAIVHDWLDGWRGGENVLAQIVDLFPDAQLFALVDFLPDRYRHLLLNKHAQTTFLQNIPGARRHFRALLPFFPKAIESLDLSAFSRVISSSHAVAKGVRVRAGQPHICYCHSPMRYAWDLREQYLTTTGLDRGVRGVLTRAILDRLKDWDLKSSSRVTHFIANSAYIRNRIERCYARSATVIYPPVDTEFFTMPAAPIPPAERATFLAASHWVPYKRMDLIVSAFRELPDKRLIVAGSGPEARRVRANAGPNVHFAGDVDRERLRELMREARALVFAAEEDFGILPVEAQACGTPVIAFGRGGAVETVRPDASNSPTGLFFEDQAAQSIARAIRRFDDEVHLYQPDACRVNALRFSTQRFRAEFRDFVGRVAPDHK